MPRPSRGAPTILPRFRARCIGRDTPEIHIGDARDLLVEALHVGFLVGGEAGDVGWLGHVAGGGREGGDVSVLLGGGGGAGDRADGLGALESGPKGVVSLSGDEGGVVDGEIGGAIRGGKSVGIGGGGLLCGGGI